MKIAYAPVRLPDPRDQPTLNLWPATGRLLGLSKQSTYDAANRGDIPVIRIGRRMLVPTAALARLLFIDDFGDGSSKSAQSPVDGLPTVEAGRPHSPTSVLVVANEPPTAGRAGVE